MQVTKKVLQLPHQQPTTTIISGKSQSSQQGSHRYNMMLLKNNAVLVFIILFFIVATTLLQLPTMNYIKFLTSNDGSTGSKELPSVTSSIVITTSRTSSSSSSSGRPSPNANDDDAETDDDDERSKGSSSVIVNSNTNDRSNVIDDDNDEDDDVTEKTNNDDDDDDDENNEEESDEEDQDESNHKENDRKEGDDKYKKQKKNVKGAAENEQQDEVTDDNEDDGKQPPQNDKNDDDEDDNEPTWEDDLSPKIVWLASYPNSGTSYTMILVERASNFSTATNYGMEVTHPNYDSIPIYPNHEVGPFWEGSSEHAIEFNRVTRSLPTSYILTKTHCGGRCIKCPASEYILNTTRQFIYGCQKTSYRKNTHTVTTEYGAPMSAIKKVLHLIRNPYHNVVARFHLERKNMIARDSSYDSQFTYDAMGFQNYCHYLDTNFNHDDEQLLPKKLYEMYFDMESDTFIPCAAEFYKWVQWHNYAVLSSTMLGLPSERSEHITIEMYDTNSNNNNKKKKKKVTINKRSIPAHVIWYEDYELEFNTTFSSIMDFLQLPVAAEQLRTFRSLPTYDDHYTNEQRQNIQALIYAVAIPSTWKLIQRYFS